MPDWFYRTVSRPLLFRLAPRPARDFTLRFMGVLSRFPGGGKLIDFLGHMRPDEKLQITRSGIMFRSSIGLGPCLDRQLAALPALARFGFGWMNLGSISLKATASVDQLGRLIDEEAITHSAPEANAGLDLLLPRIIEASQCQIPLLASLSPLPPFSPSHATSQCRQLVDALSQHVHCFLLPTLPIALQENWSLDEWSQHLRDLRSSSSRPVLLSVPVDLEVETAMPYLEAALDMGLTGIHLAGMQQTTHGWQVGKPVRELALNMATILRTRMQPEMLLIAGGGVHEPLDAIKLKHAGVDLVEVDSGLVFTGPGLPKRINDALLYQATQTDKPSRVPTRPVEMTWFWTLLMGAGMLVGSLLALLFAATTVILPYDETFLGMSRQQLNAINPNLLPFMAHDRTTLAGSMIAIGVLYLGLSWFGIRQGLHWAKVSVVVSAVTGFLSFFLFLGFGYLDPFHAFVTIVLLQFLLLGVIGKTAPRAQTLPPDLVTDLPWKQSLWGQLLLIFHAVGLMAAGLAISFIGVTQVFVQEDLEFMQTTAEVLRTADPKLIPLIAHDRATLGGMLLASGWAFLLPVLWGYRRGTSWLWWTMLIAGIAAYFAAIAIHYLVGYTHLLHLLPAFAGIILFLVGMALSFPYLGIRHAEIERHWQEILD